MSTVISSPSRIAAIGPPLTASGATWPIIRPRVAPEKRPSVTIATLSPSPSPTIAAVTWSISRIPGPPTGPSLRITTMSPGLICWSLTAREALLFGLEDPGRAGLLPALGAGDLDHRAFGREVAAQDRQASFGLQRALDRTHDFLAGRLGRSRGLLADRPAGDGDRVAVQDAGLGEALEDHRHAAGRVEVGGDEAAARLEVGEERRAAGDPLEVVNVSSMPSSWASAIRCRTPLVEPPEAQTQAIAFSSESRVITLLGVMSSTRTLQHQLADFLGDGRLLVVFGRDHRRARRR